MPVDRRHQSAVAELLNNAEQVFLSSRVPQEVILGECGSRAGEVRPFTTTAVFLY